MEYLILCANTVNPVGNGQVVSCLFSYNNRPVFTKTYESSIAVLSQHDYVALLEETAKYAWLTLFGNRLEGG